MSKRTQHSNDLGFSLLEIMVAMTLCLILMAVLLQTLLWVGQQAEQQVSELDRSAKARMILDMIEADLQSLCAINSPQSRWMCLDLVTRVDDNKLWIKSPLQKPVDESLQLESSDADPAKLRFGVGGMWLRFFTTCEDRSRLDENVQLLADVNAVAYRVLRRELSSLIKSDPQWAGYQLFRSVVRADHVFEQGYDISTYGGASHLGYPGEIPSPRLDSAVCEQVVDLGFRLLVRQQDGSFIEAFPQRADGLPSLKSDQQFFVPEDGVPDAVEVYVRVLTPKGAERLRLHELGQLPHETWWQLVERESLLYRRWVELPTTRL